MQGMERRHGMPPRSARAQEAPMSYTYRVEGNKPVHLKDYDPDHTGGLTKQQAAEQLQSLSVEAGELLDLLFAAGQNSLLIVLQGRDTSGKDGLIRHMLSYTNAQSCHVVPFKAPEPHELAHDFLWRVHQQAPARGSIALFNRSHYEDVLIVRVRKLAPDAIWKRRFGHINTFENVLMDAGTILLKFFLHISKEEQEQRLLDREKDATKAWKLAVADWTERELWDKYTEAYEDAISRCSPTSAPWYIVPANRKWFRNIAVTDCLVKTLRPYRERWMAHLQQVGTVATKELQEYRASHPAPTK
jgi:PPK2 family polyphosphate:nucleotide phosphotransferase